jgi:DNA-binding response OmpR family regulator
MHWDDPDGQKLLMKILHSRLSVFSDGQVRSLASIAAPELRDLDEWLSSAALGSPRHLLNLGEWLFQACAAHADDDHLFIQPVHFETARAKLDAWLGRQAAPALALAPSSEQSVEARTLEPPRRDQPEDTTPVIAEPEAGVPLLRLKDDGSVWRGAEQIDGWQELPDLQRSLLQYLYQNRGKLCYKKHILAHVWPEYAVGDDSLRKLVARLSEFVEPDPREPVYIHKIYGGHLRLDNAGE